MTLCKNCSPDSEYDEDRDGEVYCQSCIDWYRSECACQICGEIVEFDGYEEHKRISIIEEIGGWNDWDHNENHHFCCRKCYEEKIKPLFETISCCDGCGYIPRPIIGGDWHRCCPEVKIVKVTKEQWKNKWEKIWDEKIYTIRKG